MKDVAAMTGVLDASIMRWRLKVSAFNKAFLKAMARQWENASNIRKRGFRPYRRSGYVSPNYYDKPHAAALRGSQGYDLPTPRTWMVLPVKKRPIPYVVTPPSLGGQLLKEIFLVASLMTST